MAIAMKSDVTAGIFTTRKLTLNGVAGNTFGATHEYTLFTRVTKIHT